MTRKALDTTLGSNDFYDLFDRIVANNPQLNRQITDVRNESNIYLCEVLKFFTSKDMVEVKLLDTNRKIIGYNSHEMLSYTTSINCMCDGDVGSDPNYGTYIEPYSKIYGIIAKVRWNGISDEYCLLSCINFDNDTNLKSTVRSAEIKLTVGDSTISIMDGRVNVTTPSLFVNGLPYTAPELENYYNKTETSIIKSDTDIRLKDLANTINKLTTRMDELVAKNNLVEDVEESKTEDN